MVIRNETNLLLISKKKTPANSSVKCVCHDILILSCIYYGVKFEKRDKKSVHWLPIAKCRDLI